MDSAIIPDNAIKQHVIAQENVRAQNPCSLTYGVSGHSNLTRKKKANAPKNDAKKRHRPDGN